MEPLSAFPETARRAIRGVLCDIDDTLTSDGKLTAGAYEAGPSTGCFAAIWRI